MGKNREFLQLAHNFDAKKHHPIGWYLSEKLDGMRAFWDGFTRGIKASLIPFANIAKDHIRKEPPVSTGLWSRYGHVIHAPNWWLDSLPNFPLDGELYLGRGTFQQLVSITKRYDPEDSDWRDVRYYVFDAPHYSNVFGVGRINNTNFKKEFDPAIVQWVTGQGVKAINFTSFENVYKFLKESGVQNEVVVIHEQTKLPTNTPLALEIIEKQLDDVTTLGGEGLMLRRPGSAWIPKRTNDLIKIKKLVDTEAIIVGYTTGRRTDKGSKLLGLMGALTCKLPESGKQFEVSGFTDQERSFGDNTLEAWAVAHPGEVAPDYFTHPLFPKGKVITVRYRVLTDDGVPREAKYWR